ncbi:GR25 family glycosyltransferase involved in LPS biosynthesis [Mesorhizobium soli]|nr:GR25 family glycosyltransferase involved in LPS biosynthesis [Mesorhizobium soli]
MRSLFKAFGLEYERIAAVDGSTLSDDTIKGLVRLSPGMAPPTPAQVGCFLSHRMAWERVANGDRDYGLILEDDAIFARNFRSVVANRKLFRGSPDIIRLEGWPDVVLTSGGSKRIGHGYRLHNLTWDTYGTCGYLVSRRAAKALLKMAEHYTSPIDHMLFTASSDIYQTLDIKALVPAACYQYLWYHGEAEGPLASTIPSLAHSTSESPPPPKLEKEKEPLSVKIFKELKRTRIKVTRLANGQRWKSIDLHPIGPLNLTVHLSDI